MITALLNDTRTKIALAKRLKDAQSEVKAIEVTLTELEKLLDTARQLAAATEVCRDRLGAEMIVPVLAQAMTVAQEVQASRKRFAEGTSSHRENLALSNTGRKAQAAIKDLGERWQLYAQGQLAPYMELLRLVTYLPEVAASEHEIKQLVAQIRAQVTKPPQSAAQLAQFDGRLTELGRRLESVARLPDEVRSFLMNVVEGRATLADLTPLVRSWVEEGNRATAFSIKFV
jgi:DNA-binding FrmR family transcriptional regulator